MTSAGRLLEAAHLIVVKVGGSLLVPMGEPDVVFADGVVRTVCHWIEQGKKVVVVSSGAIMLGREEFAARTVSVDSKAMAFKQALAGIGQIQLMRLYSRLFSQCGISVGQVLLSAGDFSHRPTYINARNTLLMLLELGVVPIVNENDTVGVEEIKFGDNDTLSALVAGLLDADLLVIISDVEGLHTADPRKESQARLVELVEKIDSSIETMAQGTCAEGRAGGMRTKIEAAKITARTGVPLLLGGGSEFLLNLAEGSPKGTLFMPTQTRLQAKKRWIAYGARIRGTLIIDEGAKEAVAACGGSLLPVGIKEVKGEFQRGDSVRLLDSEGCEVGRGISYYSSNELVKIKGCHSSDIESILSYKYANEAVHRDNMVLL